MKNLTLSALFITASLCCAAQINKKIPVQKKDTLPVNRVVVNNVATLSADIVVSHDVIFFEKPNYTGASAKLVKKQNGTFYLPFPLQHVSFRVPEGKIVYIKKCSDEFPDEKSYVYSQKDVNLGGICGVRIDERQAISVVFNGISTEIHNNDCKRFAGSIKVQVVESSPDAGLSTRMPCSFRYDTRVTIHSYRHTLWDWDPSQLTNSRYDPHYNNTNTIFNNNPVPELFDTAQNFFKRTNRQYTITFFVGKSALREQRTSLILTSDLTSSHKTCDLCDDFSSGVKMAQPVTEGFPLNKPYGDGKIIDKDHPRVVAGPYMARGSRDGQAITAHAGTVKNFRVHVTVNGL